MLLPVVLNMKIIHLLIDYTGLQNIFLEVVVALTRVNAYKFSIMSS